MRITWRHHPLDVLLCLAWTLLTLAAVLLDAPGRAAAGLPFLLFIPGYLLVLALFPGRDISPVERLALSLGLSIAIVPLIGLALNYTPWGIRLEPLVVSLTAWVAVTAAVGWHRWKSLPVGERFRLDVTLTWPRGESRLDRALTLGLAISIVAAGALLVYVIVTPQAGESFTEFYILGPEGRADNYPTNLTAGEAGRVLVGIANHEHRAVNYTVEVWQVNYSHYLHFDGTTSRVEVPHHPSLNVTRGLTVAARVNASAGTPGSLLEKNGSFSLELSGRGLRFSLYAPGAEGADATGWIALTAEHNHSGWTTVAASYHASSGEMGLYINGTRVAGRWAAGALHHSTAPLYVGTAGGISFHGSLESLRLYGRALTPGEVEALAEGGAVEDGLVSRWDCTRGYGGRLVDVAGDNHGLLRDATWVNSGEILNLWLLDSWRVALNHTGVDVEGEWRPQWEEPYQFVLSSPGRYRVAFLLFTGETPDLTPGGDYGEMAGRLEEAYRSLHLWVTVHKSF
ncbi:MAG: DUF1616 domain-containing protein [Candidatus Thermoplasmatota archaeon]|nr:DUF1616 domain-containing protein [Candidatus Thermoplasmatota archaeon]